MSDYQVMPPLPPEEREALRQDVAEKGVLVPVVVDQHGNILDGHHRVEIARELGVGYPVATREVANSAEAREVAWTLNLARRHLTRDQKRQLIASEIKRCPGDSDRAIGRRLGCDHKTVGSVRRGLEELRRLEEQVQQCLDALRDVGPDLLALRDELGHDRFLAHCPPSRRGEVPHLLRCLEDWLAPVEPDPSA